MYQEIQLGSVSASDGYAHSTITLIGPQVEEHLKCMDVSITQQIGDVIYVIKLTNGQNVAIHYYEIVDLFTKPVKLNSEYLTFSHLITQNGCALLLDNDTPYLIVVTQTGQIYYKNLYTQNSSIIKNLMVDNSRFVCLAKKLFISHSLSLFLLSDSDTLHSITIDVDKGEFQRLKYQVSFGFKFSFFTQASNDWKTAFELNDKQILHYSFQTQFSLLETKGNEFTVRSLPIQDNIKVKQIEVFHVNGQPTVCYLQNNQLKIYTLNGYQLRLVCTIANGDFLQNSHFSLASISNTIFLIQGCEIYQLRQEFEQITSNKSPILGFIIHNEQMLIFYKSQLTVLYQVQDQVSLQQCQLNGEIIKFKKEADIQYKLKDEELILQTVCIDFQITNKFTQFQTLIKLLHRNLNPQHAIQMLKSQSNNFHIEQFIQDLMAELEDVYVYLKPTILKLQLDIDETYKQLLTILNYLEALLMNVFQAQRLEKHEDKEERMKFAFLKSSAVKQLKDYYFMYLESYLGAAVLCDISNQPFDLQCTHKLFYEVTCLLCLFQEKSQIQQYQDLVRQQFKFVSNDLNLESMRQINLITKKFINVIHTATFNEFPLPDEYFCEAFVQDQQKSIINKNDAQELVRFFRISQQDAQVASNSVKFLSEHEDQYQGMKLRMAFLLQKQNPNNNKEQEVILKQLINYAIKQKQYSLIFQILNMNESTEINEQLQLMIESEQLLKCQLNVRTVEQVGELLLQYARENCHNLQKAEQILQYFGFLIKVDARPKAFALLFEYVANVELQLFKVKPRDIAKVVRMQLDCISLLTNQITLLTRTDQQPFATQIVCKISDQAWKQFVNPGFIQDKSELVDKQCSNIQIINLEQLHKLREYKDIQNYVCTHYSAYAQLGKIIEQIIYHNNIDLLARVLALKIDANFEKNIAFCYFCNERSRIELLAKIAPILNPRELSTVLASLCVTSNLNLEKCKELYQMAPHQGYFLQHLINVEKEQIAQMII